MSRARQYYVNSDDCDSGSDTESDMSSTPSLPAFTTTDASSQTSYDVSVRSASPTPSVRSMTSSMRAESLVIEHGRCINNSSEVYRLPADDEEIERLGAFFLVRSSF